MKLGLPKFPKTAGTAKEFRDWDLKLREEYPVRYAINEWLTDWIERPINKVKYTLKNTYWWVQYRLNPKHQYTVVKLRRLKPGYHDTREVILYAAFEQFERFMQDIFDGNSHVQWFWTDEEAKEATDNGWVSQEEIDRRNALWNEMCEIYNWWIARDDRENQLPEYPKLPDEWGFLAPFNDDFRNTPIMLEWREVADAHNEAEVVWEEEDEEMFHRLVMIRTYLWD